MSGIHSPASSPPRFCGYDGTALMDATEPRRSIFDRYTGTERPQPARIILKCSTEGHDFWVLTADGKGWNLR